MNTKKVDRTGRSLRQLTMMALLFAMAMVLSVLESMIPALPMLPPGVKLGLSNIVTMYALFVLGPVQGYTIAILKSFFVFLVGRGPIGAAMSLAGGLTSVTVMLLLSLIPPVKKDYLLLSIFGAAFHNLGQLVAAVFVLGTVQILKLFPLLILSGVGMGIITGLVLRVIMPHINQLYQP